MSTQIQRRRGTTAQHSTFTGVEGELTVDTTKDTVVVHDGATTGGRPLLREDQTNLPTSVTNGISVPSANNVAISTGGTRRLIILSDGKVGLGAASVFQQGSQIDGGSAAGILELYNGSTGNTTLENTGAFPIIFKTNGSERLRITSDGKLGLGSSSPGAKLDVSGDVIFNGGGVQFPIQFANAFTPNSQRADLLFTANATSNNALRLGTIASSGGVTLQGTRQSDSSQKVSLILNPDGGSVGVGTASPAHALTVNPGSISIGSRGSGNAYLLPDWRIYNSSSGNALVFDNYTTEAFRVDSSNRLLVGASTGSYNLEIADNIEANFAIRTYNNGAYNHAGIRFFKSRGTQASPTAVSNGDTLSNIIASGHDGTTWQQASYIKTEVDGTPGANDMPGRLVFSTTADGASAPTERMRIKQNGIIDSFAAASAYVIRTATGAGTAAELLQGLYSASGPASGGTASIKIYTNGNIQNANNSYGALSDIKLKENIVDANSQWNDIKALRPVNYNFKEGQTHTQIGLIAQEVELVSPGLVSESPDRDEDGNDLGTVTKSVNYSVLYMKAVKALQEAMERIEQLETEMAAVKAKLP